MKSLLNQHQLNAKTKLTLALCTVLAMSSASLTADDDKDKSQGGTGSATKLETGTAGQAGQLGAMDEKFVRDAAKSGMMEVQIGKLGVQKAQNAQVKQFAQKLVDDHGKANTELQQFAAKKGITLPSAPEGITSTTTTTTTTTDPASTPGAITSIPKTDPSAVGAPGAGTGTSTDSDRTQVRDRADASHGDAQMQNEMRKLQGLTGTDFDREFVSQAVKHHEKDVRDFDQASKQCEDQELKSWINKTLPTLREHLQTAQSLQASVGSAGAPGADAGTSTSPGTSSDQPGQPAQPDPLK